MTEHKKDGKIENTTKRKRESLSLKVCCFCSPSQFTPILKHPAAKTEHFGIENCKTLTLEILFSHFGKGRGYNLKSGTISRVARSENNRDQPLVALAMTIPHFLGSFFIKSILKVKTILKSTFGSSQTVRTSGTSPPAALGQ